jgi:hypothetical protein
LKAYGPGEKVAWWVNFTYRDEPCVLAYEKFGLRLYLRTKAPEEEARKTQVKVAKQLRSSMRVVEKVILDAAPELLGKGDATVVNQHGSLRRAYEYFRERALRTERGRGRDDRVRARRNSGDRVVGLVQERHDRDAAECLPRHDRRHIGIHQPVGARPCAGAGIQRFRPAKDDLTDVIGSRWGDKFDRLLGKEGDATRYRQRLTDVVERWRNPYSHGGFEKGHGATIYLHTPGVGAVPVGLTSVRSSPLFSFIPAASETDITQVFELFGEIDTWLTTQLPEAMQWINSGLAVRFDETFRSLQAQARQEDEFEGFLAYHEYREAVIDNMDY